MKREFAYSTKNQSTDRPAPFGVFLAATIVFFVAGLSAGYSIGFVPCEFDGTCERTTAASVTLSNLPQTGDINIGVVSSIGVLPTHMKIDAIGLDLPVQNTSATDFEALDILLQRGPVRYALTGKLGESTNMVIFGHSSDR